MILETISDKDFAEIIEQNGTRLQTNLEKRGFREDSITEFYTLFNNTIYKTTYKMSYDNFQILQSLSIIQPNIIL